jgi:hypothetical protein
MENVSSSIEQIVQAAAEANKSQQQAQNSAEPIVVVPKPVTPIVEVEKNEPSEDIEALKRELQEFKEREKARSENVELTPEEKRKQEEIEKAELINFAVKNGKMKLEDFNQFDEISKADDRDLTFRNFKKEFKEDNPEIEDIDLEEEALRAFEDKYDLNSENEKRKARGEARLAKEAKELRMPLESSYKATKSEYEQERELRKTYPNFAKKIEDFTKEVLPSKLDFFKYKDGEEDVLIDVDIEQKDRDEIEAQVSKELQTPEVFTLYKNNELDKIKDKAKKIAEGLIDAKYREVGLNKVAIAFETRGKKKAEIGAKNSFALNQDANSSSSNAQHATAKEQVLNSFKKK